MGIPVIGGLRCGRSPWALTFGRAGLLVDVVSPTSIAQGMRTMLQDADLLDTLDRSWGVRAFNEYWLEEVAGKFESVLENVRQEQTR